MIKSNQENQKVCSFYASDWHLVTMLLPYINKKINEEIKIATILEQDAEEKVAILLDKLNIKNKRIYHTSIVYPPKILLYFFLLLYLILLHVY